MSVKINEKLLDERLAVIEKARNWSPRLVSKLEALIRSENEADVHRVDPIEFSEEKKIDQTEAIDLFLYSAKEGLFDMNWHLVCPMCSGLVQSFGSLKTLHSHYHCEMCGVDGEAALDDFIQISFTVSESIRKIAYHEPETLSARDLYLHHFFSRRALVPGLNLRFIDALDQYSKFIEYVGPKSEKEFVFDVAPGFMKGFELCTNTGFELEAPQGPSKTGEQVLTLILDGKDAKLSQKSVAPGKVRLKVINRTDQRTAPMLCPIHEKSPKPLSFAPFLNGKKLITTQTFRDLFRWETMEGSEGLSIKDITLLFTDLKGSTALYDRIGDLRAYSLVRQHFDSLTKVVNQHHGAVVKTIGDAVMAAFADPRDALAAAAEMLEEIENFNRGLKQREIILKIGLHKGAAIMVTLNDRLDYFGQSVNIAARVQNLADADEIWITDSIFQFEGMKDLLGRFDVREEKARLKGVSEEMRVYKLTSLAHAGLRQELRAVGA